ncbi:MAG TPA: hypothetical protein PKZ49_11005 [Nitrosomonas sp.]|nr:hypothetical protein [Nitrosomonas sp.]
MYQVVANNKELLAALETKIASEGVILNDAQIVALKKRNRMISSPR